MLAPSRRAVNLPARAHIRFDGGNHVWYDFLDIMREQPASPERAGRPNSVRKEPQMPTVEEVGKRLKEARRERDMTLKQVAEASGMSPTHISEIERGKTSPTVGALRRIAVALGKDTAYFVEDKPLPRVSVVKKEDRETVLLPGAKDTFVSARALTTGIPAGRVEAVLIQEDEGRAMDPHSHEGEEALLVLTGEARVRIGGDEFVVGIGDCLHYSAKIEHSATFTGSGKNKALWIKVTPGAIRW
jgi:transcriptional regulator with XRE-family HTH domain